MQRREVALAAVMGGERMRGDGIQIRVFRKGRMKEREFKNAEKSRSSVTVFEISSYNKYYSIFHPIISLNPYSDNIYLLKTV